MSDSFNQKQYIRLKTRLTTKRNKMSKAIPARSDASSMTDKMKDEAIAAARAVIVEVDYANTFFESTGYPDAWMDWERAKEDAEMHIRRLGGRL